MVVEFVGFCADGAGAVVGYELRMTRQNNIAGFGVTA